MDDRTLIICAATLCVVGVALTQVLGTNALGPTGTQLVSVTGVIAKIGDLGGGGTSAFARPGPLAPAR